MATIDWEREGLLAAGYDTEAAARHDMEPWRVRLRSLPGATDVYGVYVRYRTTLGWCILVGRHDDGVLADGAANVLALASANLVLRFGYRDR
jgi:hypothetical protein